MIAANVNNVHCGDCGKETAYYDNFNNLHKHTKTAAEETRYLEAGRGVMD